MKNTLSSKPLMFTATMAALGNVLSFISMQLSPIAPNIPLGPVTVSLSLDLSHLATFTAALFGGPWIGGLTGAIAGLVAAFTYGFSQGNLVTGFGVPIGKALTGIAAGYLFRYLYNAGNQPTTVIVTVLSYIPEGILTYLLFRYMLPAVTGIPITIAVAVSIQIIVKAFIEMIIMGVLLALMNGNQTFRAYAEGYFKKNP